jgi:hypothetical protein
MYATIYLVATQDITSEMMIYTRDKGLHREEICVISFNMV